MTGTKNTSRDFLGECQWARIEREALALHSALTSPELVARRFMSRSCCRAVHAHERSRSSRPRRLRADLLRLGVWRLPVANFDDSELIGGKSQCKNAPPVDTAPVCPTYDRRTTAAVAPRTCVSHTATDPSFAHDAMWRASSAHGAARITPGALVPEWWCPYHKQGRLGTFPLFLFFSRGPQPTARQRARAAPS